MKKLMVAAIAVFVVLALAASGLMVYGIVRGEGFGMSETELVNRQTFRAADFDTLDIKYGSDSVELRTTTGNEIILEEYMSKWEDKMLAKVSENNGVLNIQNGERDWNWMWYGYAVVYLPESWSGTLNAQTTSGSLRSEAALSLADISLKASSGSVRFASLTSSGNVAMEASSGSVSAENIFAAGDVTIQCSSGSIRPGSVTGQNVSLAATSGSIRAESITVSGLASIKNSSGSIGIARLEGRFAAESSSGSVRLEQVYGAGEATASSGSVKVEMRQATGDISLTSSSGSIKLELPSDASFTFEANTSSGSIRTSFNEHLSFNDKGNQASGTVGSNPAFQVTCKATSGSISIS